MSSDQDSYDVEATCWSLVAKAGDPQGAERRTALDELLRPYQGPLLFRLLSRHRLQQSDAEDLLQSFWAERVLSGELLQRASPQKGRFRNLLLTALDHFVRDQWRQQNAAKRHFQSPAKGGDSESDNQLDAQAASDVDLADLVWARVVLVQALRRTRERFLASDRPELWDIFQARVLRPILEATTPIPYEELIVRFNIATVTQAANLVITAKRSLAASLREVVGQYAGDADDASHELKRLQSIVAQASPAVDTMPELSVTQGNEASAGFFLGVDAWESVRRLFQVNESGADVWDAADLPAIWRHMLAGDLTLQLANQAEREQIQQLAASMTPSPSSLAELLLHALPDPQLLQWTKQYAKDAVSRRDAPLPREIGRGLYFLTLVQARRHGITNFSKLSDASIDQGVAWLLEQPWLDESNARAMGTT